MISTPLISFVPSSAAQPTDVLRRDNSVREVVTPLKSNLPFHRERGIGSDAERRAQTYPRSYPQQMAQARQEAGFPGFLRRSASSSPDAAPSSPRAETEPATVATKVSAAYARAQIQRDDEPMAVRYTQDGRATNALNYDWRRYHNDDMDARILERGRRVEAYYQSSYRPNDHYLIATA